MLLLGFFIYMMDFHALDITFYLNIIKESTFNNKKRFIFYSSYVIIPIEDNIDICQKKVYICQEL